MEVSNGQFCWMKEMCEKNDNKCKRTDSNLCCIHTELLCYNIDCIHKQLTHTTTFRGNPQLITGQVRGHAVKVSNMALDIVDKDLTQQCFTGIQLSQPTSWTYLLEVLPTLSENFYHFAINNYNLRRII